ITNRTSGIWTEYPLPSPITGRYFLIQVEQTLGGGGSIGGNELRLGDSVGDTNPPTLGYLYPSAGATLRVLTSIEVAFSEDVGGVDAADLLVNGQPATNLTIVSPSQYVFAFPQPATGVVQAAWAPAHAIQDLSSNAFAGGSWSYTLDTNAPLTGVIISEFMA